MIQKPIFARVWPTALALSNKYDLRTSLSFFLSQLNPREWYIKYVLKGFNHQCSAGLKHKKIGFSLEFWNAFP